MRVWLKPILGHLPLERLNSSHIEELFATIERFNGEVRQQLAEGQARVEIPGDLRAQPRICGPSTQRRIFPTLRAACNAAVRQRMITWNPCMGIELEPEALAERQRWTAKEAARFITATADDPMGLMFRIAVLRGARRGELCGFRWRTPGTDLDRVVLVVERPILQLGGKIAESMAKTAAGARKVFLDKETARLVRLHRDAQVLRALEADSAWQDNDLIFCQPDGRPWNPDYVTVGSSGSLCRLGFLS